MISFKIISAACKSWEIEGTGVLTESKILYLMSSNSSELIVLKSGFLCTVTNLLVSNFSSPLLALKVIAKSFEFSPSGS